MVSDETFFAWLDGELDAAEAAKVEAEVAADLDLTRRAERHRQFEGRLRAGFDTVRLRPVPETLVAAVSRPQPEIIEFAEAKRSRDARLWVPQWIALAATLAVGILVGTMVPTRSGAPVAIDGGKLYAAAALGQALDNQLASAPAGSVRIALTFRDRSGAICRSFTDAAAAGLACREGERWRVRGLFAAPEGQAGSYRMAAGMDPNLAALVDSTMTGEPFGPAEERAAKARGWR